MSFNIDISLFAQVTEQAALACYDCIGRGDPYKADQQAVTAMRACFNKIPADIQIVIGEGERDQAPRLYTGEKLGDQLAQLKIDVAVDPLEGTNLCANGQDGALSVMAIAPKGQLFKAPDIYMKKLACGPQVKKYLDLNATVSTNILATAKALNKPVQEIIVAVLNRPRHKSLIEDIRHSQARVKLFEDGDVAMAIETCYTKPNSADLLMGTGGAPEGVLAAAALKCLDAGFQGQLLYKNEQERNRAKDVGLKNLDKIWQRDELIPKDIIFFATGISSGHLAEAIQKNDTHFITSTLILSLNSKKQLVNKHPIKSLNTK